MSEIKGMRGSARHQRGSIEADDFDLRQSMECGQVFGWHADGEAYWGIIGDAAVMLKQTGGRVAYVSDHRISRARIASYLGLDVDLGSIRKEIARDAFMRTVVAAVDGLRILKQDPWPCLCSYILSANNRVDRIDKLVKEIASAFGRPHTVAGKTVHSLPEPRDLAGCSESGLRSCGVGFRAPYLVETAGMLVRDEVNLEAVGKIGDDEGRDLLRKLPGVGDKVADCVQLFAFRKYQAFPIDVWIKRVMERVYFHSCELTSAEIRGFAQTYFGRYAGYAQEYIYAYARTFGLEW